MMYLYMDIFGFFQDAVCSASWICRFMSFIKLGKFSTIISSNIFSASQFFLSPSGISRTQILDSQVLRVLFIFLYKSSLKCFFSLRCSVWIISINLFSSSRTHLLSSLFRYWVHPVTFFLRRGRLFYFSILKFWFASLYLLFFADTYQI